MNKISPIHPGEILKEEFLEPMGISQYRLAKDINVSPMRINEIVNGKRGISINTAFRLAKYFNMSIEFWAGLQTEYEIAVASEKLAPQINLEVRPCPTPTVFSMNV
jgi:addiction module HigA family antidote